MCCFAVVADGLLPDAPGVWDKSNPAKGDESALGLLVWSNWPHGLQQAWCCCVLQDVSWGYGRGGREWMRGRERRGGVGGLIEDFGEVHCLSWWIPDDGRRRQPTFWASLTRLQGSALSAAASESGFTSLHVLWLWFELHNNLSYMAFVECVL